MNTKTLLFGLVAMALLTLNAHAATFIYSGSATVFDSDNTGDIAIGDVFHFEFSFGDSVLDIDPGNPVAGEFPGAALSFVLTADPGNVGVYDPTLTSATLPGPAETNDELAGSIDSFIVDLAASGGTFDGVSVSRVFVLLRADVNDFVNDPGVGAPTLGDIVTLPLPELSFYDDQAVLRIENSNEFGASATITSLEVIPEPASAALLGLAAVGLLGRRRVKV